MVEFIAELVKDTLVEAARGKFGRAAQWSTWGLMVGFGCLCAALVWFQFFRVEA